MRTRLLPFAAVCCLVAAGCGGGSDDAETTTTVASTVAPAATTTTTAPAVSTTTTVPLVLEGATVIVANGNIVGGSAGRMTEVLRGAGFTMGEATNGVDKIDDSVVYYSAADGAQAVAESVATVLGGVDALPLPDPIPTEAGTLDGGDVLVVLGNNEADRSLADLSGTTDAPAGDAVQGASIVVVANANTIGGSAGRMTSQLQDAGYTVGDPINATSTITDSIVYYGTAAEAQADAEALAAAMGGIDVLPLPDEAPVEAGAATGDVLLLLGSNEADRTLVELAE